MLDGTWSFEEPLQTLPWVGFRHSVFWPAGRIDDADIEWLVEDGYAIRDCDNDGLRLFIRSRGRDLLRRIDDALPRVMPSDSDRARRIDAMRGSVAAVRRQFPDLIGFDLAYVVAQYVLAVSFGQEWMDRHFSPRRRQPDFFRSAEPAADDKVVGVVGAVHLAEMVFNLQDCDGVKKSVQMLEDGDVEAAFAEFEVAKLLSVNGHEFRFIEPRGVKGNDYDLEINLGGVAVCGETKCKLETTEKSPATIVKTLNRARNQLPPDKPGIVFVSIPPSWGGAHDDGERSRFLLSAAQEFFRQGTGRIVSVAFYTSLVAEEGNVIAPTTYALECINPRHRFGSHLSWRFFHEIDSTPDSWFSLTAGKGE